MAVLAAVAAPGVANASSDRAEFVAQARAAGLSAAQAKGLQSKVDAYLDKLDGRGTQVAPNQIDLKGAVLSVTVPGEKRPRQLGPGAQWVPQCEFGADYYWFCAYEVEYKWGDNIGMYDCGHYPIHFGSIGAWENNQTRGTRPILYFLNGQRWDMPAAYSQQLTGVDWRPVHSITNC